MYGYGPGWTAVAVVARYRADFPKSITEIDVTYPDELVDPGPGDPPPSRRR